MSEIFPNSKTVYGPVKSWRFGESLGIDPIFQTSICSFNCIYCQLGEIQKITRDFKNYVSTEIVLNDLKEIIEKDNKIDVITYSGSGEPSLAKNLGEMVEGIRKIVPDIPQFILTNATELGKKEVQENLKILDKVIIKWDTPTEEIFQKFNRPAAGVTLESLIDGILDFKKTYKGSIEVQSMFLPLNNKEVETYANFVKLISPELIQLNTPKRPYPLSWHRENRGNHLGIFDHETRNLKNVTQKEATDIENKISELTNVPIISVYK